MAAVLWCIRPSRTVARAAVVLFVAQAGVAPAAVGCRRLLHTRSGEETSEKQAVPQAPLSSSSSSSSPSIPTPTQPPPLIYPEPPRSIRHHDLASFLRHAARTGLDPGSTTYVGTHYEYTVAVHLAALGFALRRVGGASDRGIDLLGTWAPPIPADTSGARDRDGDRTPIRVILQCKAGAGQRVGPHLVRELEGAFVGAPVGWRSRAGENENEKEDENENGRDGPNDGGRAAGHATAAVIGLLVTEKPATKGIRDALARSRWPMAFVCCAKTGHVQQMLWNQRAERDGDLAGLGVTLRHKTNHGDAGDHNAHIVLTWQGRPLPLLANKSMGTLQTQDT